MERSEMLEVYRYSNQTLMVPYIATFGFFALSAWGIYTGTTSSILSPAFSALPILVRVILFAAPLMGLAAFIGTILTFRPIGIDEIGIKAFLLGQVFKSVAWSDVQRIEKRRSRDNLNERYRFEYFILAPKQTIRFQEGLCDLEELLKVVNQYIKEFGIETILVDRGRDTLRDALAATTDAVRRRKLRQEGVRSPISAL
jgi:hypothetical protein